MSGFSYTPNKEFAAATLDCVLSDVGAKMAIVVLGCGSVLKEYSAVILYVENGVLTSGGGSILKLT